MTNQPLAQSCITIPEDSKFFEGHFPGNPILPAIAQLHYVFALLSENKAAAVVSHIDVARFRETLRPGDVVSLTLSESQHGDSVSFKLTRASDSSLVSHGKLRLA